MIEAGLPSGVPNKRPSARTPLWVRVSHFLIALLFLALVYSGIVLTYSHSNFSLMDYELASLLHEIAGIAISILYVAFVIYAFYSGYWRVYLHRLESLGGRMNRAFARMFGEKIGGTLGKTDTQHRFEASTQFLLQLQLLAYIAALVILMPLLVGTGLAYLYPETSPEKVLGFAGLWPVALSHYLAGLLGTLFVLIHIYVSTIAGFRRIFFGR